MSDTLPGYRWYTTESDDRRPYSHHPYVYALGNPVNWTDPTGKYAQDDPDNVVTDFGARFCYATGGVWDSYLKVCRPRVPLPPPNELADQATKKPVGSDATDGVYPYKRPEPDEDYGDGVYGPGIGDIELGQQPGGSQGGSGGSSDKGLAWLLFAYCLTGVTAQAFGPTVPSNPDKSGAVYLYAFGGSPANNTAPRPPRILEDLHLPQDTPDTTVITPDPNNGASTFADPSKAPLTGHMYKVPKAVVLAHQDLSVIEDGRPLGTHAPTHHTIFPKRPMTIREFRQLYADLPWQYAGKK